MKGGKKWRRFEPAYTQKSIHDWCGADIFQWDFKTLSINCGNDSCVIVFGAMTRIIDDIGRQK